jgi:hypothetical protein
MEGQVANDALPTTGLSASAAAAAASGSLTAGRFRNWKILAFELAVALLGFCFFSITATTTGNLMIAGIVCFIAAIGALWLFRCELLGISIDSETLTMPKRHIPSMPAISFRRQSVMLSEVRRLTLSAASKRVVSHCGRQAGQAWAWNGASSGIRVTLPV